jgi:hypothetical protein
VHRCRDLEVHDQVEEAAGEDLLDALLEPEIRRNVGHVSGHRRAGTACEQSDDASLPVDDDGTRVTGGGECAIFVAVGVYGNLQRRLLEAILAVLADESGMTDSIPATRPIVTPVVLPFLTTRRHSSPLASSRFGLRSSASLTTPLTWRRPPRGYLKSDWPSG